MTELNLENIRKDIDDIDSELTALFKKRMEKSLEVPDSSVKTICLSSAIPEKRRYSTRYHSR